MKNLIVDLRNNPGGLLNVAVDTCRLFIGSGKLLSLYGRAPSAAAGNSEPTRNAPYETLPMVILVNHGSASGSEIFSGCLQDYHRAVIMGSETFGKGSVQSVIPLADGSGLRLTTAKYYTPSGRTFHRSNEKTGKDGGVTPGHRHRRVTREVEIKLQAQEEEIFGTKPKTDKEIKDHVEDEALERAKEVLKSRDIFLQMNTTGS